MKYLLILSFILLILSGCNKQEEQIVRLQDIKPYLLVDNTKKSKELETLNININFWMQRLKDHPDNSSFKEMAAGFYDTRFKYSGNIDDLLASDSLLERANIEFKESESSILQSLAQNAISRHQFKIALELAKKVFSLTDARETSAVILADALMETGNYDDAKSYLIRYKDDDFLPYLIRESRFVQHEGNLDSAITIVKDAYLLAKKDNNTNMICYCDNLAGTYYIEAGKGKEAYSSYLDALSFNPYYVPALEGIAAVALLFDKNTDIAKDIYESLSQRLSSPDPYLNLYKIAKFNNDEAKKQEYLKIFLAKANNPKYGRMYNKYIINIEAEEFKNYDKAKQIAQSEIDERPTPPSYFLLAWAYYQSGDIDKSIEIIKNKVEGKTTDPEILTKIDRIYLEQTKKM